MHPLIESFSNVRYAPIEDGRDMIFFSFKGKNYKGALCGRNSDLILSRDPIKDGAIAFRVFLDGQAKIVESLG